MGFVETRQRTSNRRYGGKMLVTNELLTRVWEVVERINENIVKEQEVEGMTFEAYIRGNYTCLEIRFMDHTLWSSEENDTSTVRAIFIDSMAEMKDLLASLKRIDIYKSKEGTYA
jgi:hypothetical protein